jgi:hypothetical protein
VLAASFAKRVCRKACIVWTSRLDFSLGASGVLRMGRHLLSALAFICLLLVPPVLAQSTAEPKSEAINPASLAQSIQTSFDGRVYVAAFGQDDKLANGRDVVRFKNGIMSSDNCIKFGFMPAPYLLRVEGDRTYFYSEMPSKEQGLMRFSGYIENDSITASAKWRQARWYWDVDVELRFVGKRANPGDKLEASFKP